MNFLGLLIPPPPPLAPGATPLEEAVHAQTWGKPTIDQVWILRDHYANIKNIARRGSWGIRLRLL